MYIYTAPDPIYHIYFISLTCCSLCVSVYLCTVVCVCVCVYVCVCCCFIHTV